MQDIELQGKRLLIRLDLNVPMQNGHIESDARIQAALPTIRLALDKKACVMLMSHLGRPKEGLFDARFSCKPIAEHLGRLLGQKVIFIPKDQEDQVSLSPGEVALLENVRFYAGEQSNDPALAKKMAAWCDVFVMDAFGSSHRAHASTTGVALYAPVACAGPLLALELENLQRIEKNPQRPVVAIVGGAKISTKLPVLESLIQKVDVLLVGGGIANTLLAAEGFSVGKSLYEPDAIGEAERLLQAAQNTQVNLPLPSDVVVAEALTEDAPALIKSVSDIGPSESICDLGPSTIALFCNLIQAAGTVIWNGPVGVFEFARFATGTERIAKAVAASPAFTVAGGGETIAAIERYRVQDCINFISTGGGAFLEFLEGKPLPAIKALERKESP